MSIFLEGERDGFTQQRSNILPQSNFVGSHQLPPWLFTLEPTTRTCEPRQC